jgi:hypothetical protein
MANIHIIFQNDEIKGYVGDEQNAKRAVSELADYLIEELKNCTQSRVKIFRENIENGVKIYNQAQGQYFNGTVILQHTLMYKPIPEYK